MLLQVGHEDLGEGEIVRKKGGGPTAKRRASSQQGEKETAKRKSVQRVKRSGPR